MRRQTVGRIASEIRITRTRLSKRTEGYRPGGTNRSRGDPFFPNTYFADKMTNWETGLKSMFADGAVRLNVTAFYMDWEDYQLELVDPSQNTCPPGGPAVIPNQCGQPW